MKMRFALLLMLALIFAISTCLLGYAQDKPSKDTLLGENAEATYLSEPGSPFDLIITDVAGDGNESKGVLRLFTADNFTWEFDFYFEDGKSGRWGIKASDRVEKVVIYLESGAVSVDHGGKLTKEARTTMPPAKTTPPFPAGSFSASTLMNIAGNTIKGRIYLKDHIYRYDIIPGEEKTITVKSQTKNQAVNVNVETTFEVKNISIVVDRRSQKAFMIDHDEKTYLEVPVFHLTNAQDFKASYLFSPLYFYNPVEAHYAMSLVYDVVESGEEDVEGLLCEKRELQTGNFLVQKAWISRKYGIPVKLINYVQGETQMVFEVKDIEEVSLDASIFEIPEGYRPMKGE